MLYLRKATWLCFLLLGLSPAVPHAADDSIAFPVEMGDFTVVVRDSSGNPLANVEVELNGLRCKEEPGSWFSWPASNAGAMPSMATDPTGTVTFKYPKQFGSPGRYQTTTVLTFNFRHPEYIAARAESAIEASPLQQELKAGCRVTYSAVDEQQQPLERFGAFIAGPGYDATWIREDGKIRSRAIPDGAWQTLLVAPRDDGLTLFSDLLPARYASGKEVTIRNVKLTPGLKVSGTLSPNVPRPVQAGVVVAWSQPKPTAEQLKAQEAVGWSDSAEIRADGSFEFPSLPRGGRLQLLAVCRGWVITDQPRPEGRPILGPFIKTGMTLDVDRLHTNDTEIEGVELPMEPAGAVRVIAKHQDGSPAAGLNVYTSPNQLLEDEGTLLLGTCYPSIDQIKSRIDGTRLEDPWQHPQPSRYRPATDAKGIATLHDLPTPHAWDIFVGNRQFRMVKSEDGERGRKVSVDDSQLQTIEVVVEPIQP